MNRTVTAELWRPAGLREAAEGGTTDDVADRRKSWAYDSVTDPEYLARTVAATVETWLDQPRGGDGATGRATAPQAR